ESSNAAMNIDNFEALNYSIYQYSDEETIISSDLKLILLVMMMLEGVSFTLQTYLDHFLYDASQSDALLNDIKYAIYSAIGDHENYGSDGLPVFPQIDLSEFKMNTSNHIAYKYDLDSFLLNTYTLNIITRPIQFFYFTNRLWNLNYHNYEYHDIIDNNGINRKVKLVNIPHFQLAQFGDFGIFKILVFFPKMYRVGSKKRNYLTDATLSIWYDQIFLPALKDSCQLDVVHHYPFCFDAYLFKAKKDSGYYFHYPYDYFFHIYSKNTKLYTKFQNILGLHDALNFIYSHFSLTNDSWKNNTQIDFGIEFVSNNITPPESVYWARNSAINLLAGLGINFTTNVSASRIDNWLHTYDICGAIGEAKQAAIQNSIYYAQAYHIEKKAFSTSTSMLLAELTENTILKYSKKVNKACENLIQILNNINDTNFGARLEYRIEVIKQYVGNSAKDNPHNVGTLEIYKIIKESNTQIQDSNNNIEIDPAIKTLIRHLVTTISSEENHNDEMNQLSNLIWKKFIEDYDHKTQESRFNMYFNELKPNNEALKDILYSKFLGQQYLTIAYEKERFIATRKPNVIIVDLYNTQ
ncbi:9194_t:CDS:2, partial [Gigaspora rosea]